MNNNWSTEESLVQKPNWWADNSLYFSRSSNKELKMTHMWIRCGTPKNPLFGIYWWTLRNPKNKNFEKMKTNCWRYHYFTHVYQKPQSYEVQILRNEVSQFFFCYFGWVFALYLRPKWRLVSDFRRLNWAEARNMTKLLFRNEEL